jgi:hypothetical protein
VTQFRIAAVRGCLPYDLQAGAKVKRLGSFALASGKMVISDPCYNRDVWCSGELTRVAKGNWNAFAFFREIMEGTGVRVSALLGLHDSYEPGAKPEWVEEPIDVGVDSGQAGFFDSFSYKNDDLLKKLGIEPEPGDIADDELWYSYCCRITLSDKQAGVLPGGAVSSSGMGDGSYVCRTKKQRGRITAVLLDYGLTPEKKEVYRKVFAQAK